MVETEDDLKAVDHEVHVGGTAGHEGGMGSAHAELPNLSSIFSLSTQGKGGFPSFFFSSSSS